MNVNQFVEHILKHMSAEEALKKLLTTTVEQYNQLIKHIQESHPDKGGSPYMLMAMAALELGWDIALESNHEKLRGLTVGSKDYIKETFKSKGTEVFVLESNEAPPTEVVLGVFLTKEGAELAMQEADRDDLSVEVYELE